MIPMRRKEKQIDDPRKIVAIFEKAQVCRLAMWDGQRPYLVPMSFGYADDTLYFHSATAGRKVDVLRQYPQVCFEVETDLALEKGEKACQWGMRFKSVIGIGRTVFIEDDQEKAAALQAIVRHYAGAEMPIEPARLNTTLVFKVIIEEMTAKGSSDV
jgi:nitroimidazol reductase NimA-like FMN-containing flavoprotein (pyridoxamine 5'-phosphate oxidase superfamily)